MAELAAAATLGGAGLAYAVGLSRMWDSAGRGRLVRASQARNFVAAQVVLAAALLMPHGSLTAHMVQHVLLLVVAAPLLAMGAPLPTMLWALPARRRTRRHSAGDELRKAPSPRLPSRYTDASMRNPISG